MHLTRMTLDFGFQEELFTYILHQRSYFRLETDIEIAISKSHKAVRISFHFLPQLAANYQSIIFFKSCKGGIFDRFLLPLCANTAHITAVPLELAFMLVFTNCKDLI